MFPSQEKVLQNSTLNPEQGWGFNWDKKQVLLSGVIVICLILLIKPQWLQWLTTSSLNLGLLAGGLHSLNFLIKLTQ